MTDLPPAVDDWDSWHRHHFWRQILRAPEMQAERIYPVRLAELPLTRLYFAYERGEFGDDDPYGDDGPQFDP